MMEAYALTDKGCVRSNNEDYCRIDPRHGVYVLADGMGGARAGETASRLAVDTVFDLVMAAGKCDSQVLLGAVEEANRRVLAAAGADPNLDGMGTTLVAALEIGHELAVASVGDSRAYLHDSGGLRVITQDQTWVNEVGRPLGLDEDNLRTHPMRHVLTMAIGAASSLVVNYYVVSVERSAVCLICSDGLHGVVPPETIEKILSRAGKIGLEAAGRELVEAAKNAGGPDNISVVLLQPQPSPTETFPAV